MERKSDLATASRIYDEFDPIFNWKTEQGFETLTIYLPGFRKEQLKVQITTTRKVRVMGERPAGANKWIRFRKEFPVQANIDVDSIAAKFEGTNLVVKLPILGTTAKPPPVPKETEKVQPPKPNKEKEPELDKQAEKAHQLPKQAGEKETKPAEKEEAHKAAGKGNVCDGVKEDYRSKVNEYKENLGGYVALMKNNQRAITLGMVAPAAAVLLLSIGFYAGQMFTS